MLKLIDDFLNSTTMYRLMLYYLALLWFSALVFCLLGIININPIYLILSTSFIVLTCWVTNKLFSKLLNAPTNFESVYITAVILSLIISPTISVNDLPLLFLTSVVAIASKFLIAINHQHIFNPAAFGAVFAAFILNQPASWWIGVLPMLPFILGGGLLIVRKLQRSDLVLSYIFVTLIISLLQIAIPANAMSADRQAGIQLSTLSKWITRNLLDVQLLFFAFVMLTEPQTTPPKKNLRIIYGGLVGILGSYFTLELTLIIGNLFSYISAPRPKLLLKLDKRISIAANTFEFIFKGPKFNFLPGQYLEWTLSHPNPDLRGNRRFFTIASSPTEEKLHLGIKFYEQGSSFKRALTNMKAGDTIVASQLAGEFTLPNKSNIPLVLTSEGRKLCFIAGGIGITPFRSMIKYLLDKKEKREIVLIYAVKGEEDIAYKNLLEQAQKKLGIKVVYQTDQKGRVDEKLIKQTVADFKNNIFYLSGPHGMVTAFDQLLKGMGIPKNQIKVDFFPGYA